MATVITNLLSAVPFFGQDLVESNNITKLYSCLIHMNNTIPVLGTIGTVSQQALKKGKKIRLDKEEYLSVPYPFIAFLVGFIDGDGYIQITKTTKGFIAIRIVIELSLNDISSLEYINSVLKIGKITIYRDRINPTCKLVINKTDLQEIFFPLLLHHNIFFLTESRRAQFDLAMYIFKNNIKNYKEISHYTQYYELTRLRRAPTIFELPKKALDYVNLPFFKNWLVGFTNANKYQGVIEFIQEKPLNYKRVKSELKKLFSNRNSYYFLLKILKNKLESPIDSTTFKIRKANYKIKNIRNFSTSAISDITNSSPILVEGGSRKTTQRNCSLGAAQKI